MLGEGRLGGVLGRSGAWLVLAEPPSHPREGAKEELVAIGVAPGLQPWVSGSHPVALQPLDSVQVKVMCPFCGSCGPSGQALRRGLGGLPAFPGRSSRHQALPLPLRRHR